MADSTLSNLPTATSEVANDALIYIVDDLASSTATSLQTEFDAFQQIRQGTTTATDAYTAVLADAYKLLRFTGTGTSEFNLPPTSSVAYPRGTWIHILQGGVGRYTVTSTSTAVAIESRASVETATQYSMISLFLRSTATAGTWVLTGDMATE